MSVRKVLNQYPSITVLFVLALIGAAVLITYQSKPDAPPAPPTKYYYSVDDGKTYFAGPMNLVPPFMHEGKEAVRAYVYSCDDGDKPFVAYLEKYSDEFKRRAEGGAPASRPTTGEAQQPSLSPSSPPIPLMSGPDAIFNRLVKKPGDTEWYPFASGEGQAAIDVSCDGDRNKLLAVYPKDDR